MKTKNLTNKQLKIFGFILIIIFTVFSYSRLINSKAYLIIFIFMQLYFLNIIFFNTRKLESLAKIWIRIGDFLGKINSLILLTLFFYLIMTPLSLFMKLIKLFSFKKTSNSYYLKPIRETDFTEEF